MEKDKLIVYANRCVDCEFYFGVDSCMAFMDKIPDEILHGDNPHNEPLKNQENEIVFKQLEF
jgi:hypothetical protein